MMKNSNVSISKVTLPQFDFSALEEQDPILQEGLIPIYDQEIQFRIQLAEKEHQTDDFPNAEALRVRVLVQGNESNLENMVIELSSDNDLFFHFVHKADLATFEKLIQPSQQLCCKFQDYPAVCVKNFDKCLKEGQNYLAVLTIMPDGQGRVDIVQMTEFRNVELISFDFLSSEDDVIRNIITYKYQTMKQKLGQMESRLKDINDVVKIRNPSLLLQIQKQNVKR